MRQTRKSQLALGEARIEDIKLDHKSRDDIPAVLLGLQHLYSHEETREKLFSLLEEHILPGTNRNVGRPGMSAAISCGLRPRAQHTETGTAFGVRKSRLWTGLMPSTLQ